MEKYTTRTERRNAVARAQLAPLEPGERPWPLLAGVVLTTVAGTVNVVLFALGTKVGGRPPQASDLLFTAVMAICAVGMWRLWYQAVLGFMVLLALVVIYFSLLMVEASNLLGLLVPPVFIIGGGLLFWKLVRVLGRLQAPARPQRQ